MTLRKQFCCHSIGRFEFLFVFTALHGMAARTSYEKAVCLSVRLSVCRLTNAWIVTNGRKFYPSPPQFAEAVTNKHENTTGDSCDGEISALNHCLSWSKFVSTHLYHSRQWFNLHVAIGARRHGKGGERFNCFCVVLTANKCCLHSR